MSANYSAIGSEKIGRRRCGLLEGFQRKLKLLGIAEPEHHIAKRNAAVYHQFGNCETTVAVIEGGDLFDSGSQTLDTFED